MINALQNYRWFCPKLEKGKYEMSIQSYAQVLNIASLTGFRAPPLLGDFTHLFAEIKNDKSEKDATIKNFNEFQTALKKLSADIDERNTKRKWPFENANPKKMECSVSI